MRIKQRHLVRCKNENFPVDGAELPARHLTRNNRTAGMLLGCTMRSTNVSLHEFRLPGISSSGRVKWVQDVLGEPVTVITWKTECMETRKPRHHH